MGITPLVHCAGCERAWHSASMAEGLRLVGACPRCGGELVWAGATPEMGPSSHTTTTRDDDLAPHLVLGVPRR